MESRGSPQLPTLVAISNVYLFLSTHFLLRYQVTKSVKISDFLSHPVPFDFDMYCECEILQFLITNYESEHKGRILFIFSSKFLRLRRVQERIKWGFFSEDHTHCTCHYNRTKNRSLLFISYE